MERHWTHVAVPDGALEVLVTGAGDPVLLVQTAQVADELLPVADLLAPEFRVLVTHRRGYAGSSPTSGAGSIPRDATDCAAVLTALRVDRAHVVGLSFSGAIAMELARTQPGLVRTLTLIEPPPVHIPAAAEFRAVNAELLGTVERAGTAAALEAFMTLLLGVRWRTAVEQHLPGGVAAIERDVDTFFRTDIPALLAWEFDADDARPILHPVLHIGGTASGPWFAQVRELVLQWFPQAEDVVVPGADHSLALTHAQQVAAAIREFLLRHPVDRA